MSIAVVGSINVDLSYVVKESPKPGETVLGEHYAILNGGKGANQAVLLKREVQDTLFLGAVGSDTFADIAVDNLESKGLSSETIVRKHGETGFTLIEVKAKDNTIVVFPGANDQLTEEDVEMFLDGNPQIEWLVTQFEISMPITKHLIRSARNRGIKVILNPAPAKRVSQELIDSCHYIIPNETEFRTLFGENADMHEFLDAYKGKLIVTLGSDGVMFYDEGSVKRQHATPVDVVDTTGAGDSFIAGFAARISQGATIEDAVRYGNTLAGKSCECFGAQCLLEGVSNDEKKGNN